jgi:hypothetical protein
MLGVALVFIALSLLGMSCSRSQADRRVFGWSTGGGVLVFVLFVIIVLTGCTPY